MESTYRVNLWHEMYILTFSGHTRDTICIPTQRTQSFSTLSPNFIHFFGGRFDFYIFDTSLPGSQGGLCNSYKSCFVFVNILAYTGMLFYHLPKEYGDTQSLGDYSNAIESQIAAYQPWVSRRY